MDSHSTPPTTSAAPAPTKIKHGAGVGAAIGLAISWCIGLGLGSTWHTTHPDATLFAIAGVVAAGVVSTIAIGAAFVAVIGWSVPVNKPAVTH